MAGEKEQAEKKKNLPPYPPQNMAGIPPAPLNPTTYSLTTSLPSMRTVRSLEEAKKHGCTHTFLVWQLTHCIIISNKERQVRQ